LRSAAVILLFDPRRPSVIKGVARVADEKEWYDYSLKGQTLNQSGAAHAGKNPAAGADVV